jgi:xylulokinase
VIFDVLAGIDVGTSSVKVTLLGPDGGVFGEGVGHYATSTDKPGWAEQDPQEWWDETCRAFRGAMEQAQRDGRRVTVTGMGVTGQMHSFVLLDAKGELLRPAMVWLDSRARDLVPEVRRSLERAGLSDRICNRPAPGLTLPMLLWLLRHRPEELRSSAVLLLAKDYVRYRLTGTLATDVTDASGTLLLDVPARKWLPEIGETFGLDLSILPPITDPWESVGRVTPESARELGLSGESPVVVTGAADQQAAALSTDVLTTGSIQLMIGTGAQVLSPSEEAIPEAASTLNVFCHYNNWIVQGSAQNGGVAIDWARRVLGVEWDAMMGAAESESRGPIFFPYLTGERTPIMNEMATGAWVNLRFGDAPEQLAYAAVEGVAFGVVDNVEAVFRYVPAVSRVRASGGATRHTPFLRLVSDTLNRELTILQANGAPGTGAAILAAFGAGLFSNISEASKSMGLAEDRTIVPRVDRHEVLRKRLDWYREARERYLRWDPVP